MFMSSNNLVDVGLQDTHFTMDVVSAHLRWCLISFYFCIFVQINFKPLTSLRALFNKYGLTCRGDI